MSRGGERVPSAGRKEECRQTRRRDCAQDTRKPAGGRTPLPRTKLPRLCGQEGVSLLGQQAEVVLEPFLLLIDRCAPAPFSQAQCHPSGPAHIIHLHVTKLPLPQRARSRQSTGHTCFLLWGVGVCVCRPGTTGQRWAVQGSHDLVMTTQPSCWADKGRKRPSPVLPPAWHESPRHPGLLLHLQEPPSHNLAAGIGSSGCPASEAPTRTGAGGLSLSKGYST